MPSSNDVITHRQVVVFDSADVSGAILEWCRDPKHGVRMAVRENEDDEHKRTHYHIAVHFPEGITLKTLQTYVKKLPGVRSNKQYNTTAWDGRPDLYRYFCKGAKDNSGILPDVIHNATIFEPLKLHEEFHKNAVEYATKKKAKAQKPDAVAEIIKLIEWVPGSKPPGILQICDAVLKFYKGKVNDHHAFAVIQAVEYHFDPDGTRMSFQARMVKRFHPS